MSSSGIVTLFCALECKAASRTPLLQDNTWDYLCHLSPELDLTLILHQCSISNFSCAAPSFHLQKHQPLSDFWAALADEKEETIGSATFLKLEGGNKFPHEGGVADRLSVRDCYKVFAKQVTDYCEQLVNTNYADGVKKEPIDAPVFILRGNPGGVTVQCPGDIDTLNGPAAALDHACQSLQ